MKKAPRKSIKFVDEKGVWFYWVLIAIFMFWIGCKTIVQPKQTVAVDRFALLHNQGEDYRQGINEALTAGRKEKIRSISEWESRSFPASSNIAAKLAAMSCGTNEVHVLTYFWDGKMRYATNRFTTQ